VKAAAYVRVSSRAQDHATQRSAIERAARARGDRIAQWFVETLTAKSIARPELGRLRAAARAGELEGPRLYVFKLDRLARSGIRDTFEVVDELRGAGVDLVTVADGFALDGPAADVVIAVMAWAAKMERQAIGERIAAARVRVEAEGGRWGRPSRVDEPTRAKALALKASGETVRAIARLLHVPRSTIGRAITPCRSSPQSKAGRAPGR
jgi:putative DNA-invertase from lambdoid prophage Rac